jgi:hypothetical protein
LKPLKKEFIKTTPTGQSGAILLKHEGKYHAINQ